MSFSRRRVTIFAGFGSVALIVLAVTVFQKELMTQYYLFRLRNDSSYLQSILGKPEGTSQGAAVRQYLDIPEGRAALLRVLLRYVKEEELRSMRVSRKTHTYVLELPRPLASLRSGSGYTTIFREDDDFFEDTSSVYEVGRIPYDSVWNDMMQYLIGRNVTLPEHPELTFMCHDLETWQQYLRSKRE